MFERSARCLAILAIVILSHPIPVFAAVTSAMEAELMCQCGCGKVVVNCTCGTADEMRARIAALVDQGKGRKAVLKDFVSRYGEVVLSSPPKKGFNLVAYGVPLSGLALGSVIAVTVARRWRFSRREDEEGEPADGGDVSEEMEERIRAELEEMED